jgi:hypothetical protein
MRDLVRRLRAVSRTDADRHVDETAVVNEKLRIPLTRFAGAEDFASLLRRALMLARADVSSLQSVKVGARPPLPVCAVSAYGRRADHALIRVGASRVDAAGAS